MEDLIEVLTQIQELAGVAIEALTQAGGSGEGGAPPEGAPPAEGGAPQGPPPGQE